MADNRYYGLRNWFVYGRSNERPNDVFHVNNYHVTGPWRALELAQEELDNKASLRQRFIDADIVALCVQGYEDVATGPFRR